MSLTIHTVAEILLGGIGAVTADDITLALADIFR